MANPLSINITGKLDKQKTIDTINAQISQLSNGLKSLHINLDVDSTQLNKINKQISEIQKKANGSAKINPVDSEGTKRSITAIEGEMRTSMQRIAKSLRNGNNHVKLTELYDVDGAKEQLRGFTATVDNLKGKIDKLTYLPAAKGDTQLVQVGKQIIDNTDKVDAAITKAKTSINNSLAEIGRRGLLTQKQLNNFGGKIANADTIEKLNQIKQSIKSTTIESQHLNDTAKSQKQIWDALAKSQKRSSDNAQKSTNAQNKAINKALEDKYLTEEKARLEIQDALFKTQQRRINNAQKAEQAQSAAINKALEDEYKLQKQTEKTNAALKEQIANWQRQATVQANNMGYRFDDFSKLDPSYTNRLNEIKRNINEINNIPLDQAKQRMNDIRLSMRELGSQAEIAGGRVQTFGDDFKRATSAIAVWTASGGVIFGLIHGFQNLVQTLIDVDTQMTELERVMDAPQSTYDQMLQDSVDLSNQLSVKLNDVLTITNEFARQGFSPESTMQLTKTAALLENISDITPEDSMNALTAAMKSFNIPASEAISIADKLNQTDNEFSINTVQLAQGLFRASSTAKAYGVSLDDLLGQITAVGEVTRESGNILGTFLKTLYSRLLSSPDSAKALDSIGISVKEANGEMRSATDVLDDLYSKWGSLSDAQRQSIGVTVAGREQLSRFFALMQNYSTSIDASTTSLHSQGSAVEENIKYQDSLQARLNRLQNQWSEFSIMMGNAFVTDGLVAGISLITKFGQVATAVVDHVGALPIAFAAVSTALVLFNRNIRTSILQGTLFSAMSGRLKGALISLAAAANTLKASWRGLLKSTGIGLIFMGISFAIEGAINSIGKYREEQRKASQELQKQTDLYQSHSKEINNLVEEYKQLSSQVSNGDISPTDSRYLNVQNKLNDLLPSLTDKVDKNGQAHLKSADSISKEVAQLNKLANAKAYTFVKNFSDKVDDVNKKIKDSQNELKHLDVLSDPNASPRNIAERAEKNNYDPNDMQNVADRIVAESEYQNLLKERIRLFKQLGDKYAQAQGYADDLTKSDQKYIDSYVDEHENMVKTEKGADKLEKKIKSLVTNIGLIRKVLGDDVSTGFLVDLSEKQFNGLADLSQKLSNGEINTKEFSKALKKLKFFGGDVKDIMDALTGSQNKNNDVTKEQTKSIIDLTSAIKDAGLYADTLSSALFPDMPNTDEMTRAANAYQLMATMVHQLGGESKLSADQQQLLKQSYDILAANFPQYVNGHNLNIGAMQKEIKANGILEEAVQKAANGMLTSEQAATMTKASAVRDRIDATIKEIKALDYYQQAYTEFVNSMQNNEENMTTNQMAQGMRMARYLRQRSDTVQNTSKYKNLQSALKDLEDGYYGLTDGLEKSMNGINKSSSSADKASSSMDKATQSVTRYKYVHDRLAESLAKVNAQFQMLQDKTQRYDKTSSQYRNSISQEISLLKQKGNLLKQQERSLSSQIRSGNVVQYGTQSSTTTTYSGSGKLSPKNYGSAVNRWVPQIESAAAAMGVELTSNMLNVILRRIKQESGGSETVFNNWDSNARAGHPSRGLLQYIPSTFNSYKVSGHGNILSGYDQLLAMFNDSNWLSDISSSGGWGPSGRKRSSSVIGSSGGSSSSITIGQSAAERQQAIVQAKNQLYDVQQQIIQNENAIQQAYMDIVDSHIAAYEARVSGLNDDIAKYKYEASIADQTSKDYIDAIKKQIELFNKQKSIEQDKMDYIMKQYKYNKHLNSAQRAELWQQYNDQKTNFYDLLGQINDLNNSIKQVYQNLADTVIQDYKDFYQQQLDVAQKAHDKKVQLIDDETQKYQEGIQAQIDAIDRLENKDDYNDELKERQKAVQDIQNKINNYSLEMDTPEGRARVNDLREQLEDAQKELSDFQHQHSIEMRKQSLQDAADSYQENADAQKKAADDQLQASQDQINEIINDNAKWTKVEQDILKGHYGNVLKDFQNFSNVFKKESDLIGKSITNNLVNKIKDLSNQIKGLGLSGNGSNTYGYATPGVQIPQFADGGYTGKWSGKFGKLAILHSDELVLNASQRKALPDVVTNLATEMFAKLRNTFTPRFNTPQFSMPSMQPQVIDQGVTFDVHDNKFEGSSEQQAEKIFGIVNRKLTGRGIRTRR